MGSQLKCHAINKQNYSPCNATVMPEAKAGEFKQRPRKEGWGVGGDVGGYRE